MVLLAAVVAGVLWEADGPIVLFGPRLDGQGLPVRMDGEIVFDRPIHQSFPTWHTDRLLGLLRERDRADDVPVFSDFAELADPFRIEVDVDWPFRTDTRGCITLRLLSNADSRRVEEKLVETGADSMFFEDAAQFNALRFLSSPTSGTVPSACVEVEVTSALFSLQRRFRRTLEYADGETGVFRTRHIQLGLAFVGSPFAEPARMNGTVSVDGGPKVSLSLVSSVEPPYTFVVDAREVAVELVRHSGVSETVDDMTVEVTAESLGLDGARVDLAETGTTTNAYRSDAVRTNWAAQSSVNDQLEGEGDAADFPWGSLFKIRATDPEVEVGVPIALTLSSQDYPGHVVGSVKSSALNGGLTEDAFLFLIGPDDKFLEFVVPRGVRVIPSQASPESSTHALSLRIETGPPPAAIDPSQ